MNSTREVADWLVNELASFGFTIQRYNAYGSKSIYLKLDYGKSHSIRISDHKGYGHLKYRYNVRTDRTAHPRTHMDVYPRHYYSGDRWQLRELVTKVIEERDAQIYAYGIEEYRMQMRERMHGNEGRRGFWSEAVVVAEGVPQLLGKLGQLNEGVIQW